MYDTIAAYLPLERKLDARWSGGSRINSAGRESLRLWRNPSDGEYHPRCTWYRPGDEPDAAGSLRVEFSIPKLVNMNVLSVTHEQALMAIRIADAWLSHQFGDLPSLMSWKVLRIDYAWNWYCFSDVRDYLSVFQRARLASRAPMVYEHGAMWKQSARAVKVYDKSRESGVGQGVLRLEVSNQRDAVRYMCKRWFGCERTVRELVHPGRALYVLSHFFEQLGAASGSYESTASELPRLVSAFGDSAAQAAYVLRVVRECGSDGVKLGYVSQSMYYRYKKALASHGFLSASDATLSALHLPTHEVFHQLTSGQNLKNENAPERKHTEKILREILGLTGAQASEYLLARWREYATAN